MALARVIPLTKPSLFNHRSTWVTTPEPTTGAVQIPDAPADGQTWGRLNNTWEPVVPLTGATMRGRLFLVGLEPIHPFESVPKWYVDRRLKNLDAGEY
jgi:hypothetical protein